MLRELYERCLEGPWITSGLDVQYKIQNGELIFQCSQSKMDWIHNFEFWIKPYKQQTITWYAHAGFVKLWKSVRDEVATHYGSINRIAGYSQGSALAQLAAEDYCFTTGKAIDTVGFGCPRVFWIPGKYVCDSQKYTTLVMADNDLVTCLPFAIWGYRHVGEQIVFPGTGLIPSPKAHYPDIYRGGLNAIEKGIIT
jgi:hypothetical protein